MTERDCTIYLLRDPRDGAVRYIGKTVRGMQVRLRAHICRTNLTPKRHSSRWIAGLIKAGMVPLIEEIEIVSAGGDWQHRERFWIAQYRSRGARLTNLADGGEGVAGVRFTEERKRELSERFKGRVFDDEWKAKISAAKKGVPGKSPTSEVNARRAAKIRETMLAKSAQKTHCRHGHEWVAGQKHCKECKAEYFQRTYRRSPKTREERAAALDELRRLPEFRNALSEGAKRRASDPEYRKVLSERAKRLPRRRGTDCPNAKLDWDKVADIRRRNAQGEPRAALAKEYGVSPAVVDRIIWNKAWVA